MQLFTFSGACAGLFGLQEAKYHNSDPSPQYGLFYFLKLTKYRGSVVERVQVQNLFAEVLYSAVEPQTTSKSLDSVASRAKLDIKLRLHTDKL